MENLLPRIDKNQSGTSRIGYSVAGIALLSLGMSRRHSIFGGLLSLAGIDLVTRGMTGHHLYEVVGISGLGRKAATIPYQTGIKVHESVTVNVERYQAYSFFRDLENLPRFMKHLVSVTKLDSERSHWIARGPAGVNIEWDGRITNDVRGEVIGWRSEEGADVTNSGSVHFRAAPEGSATIICVDLQYLPPGGALGAVIAKLFGEEPEIQVRSDLQRLKQVLESGEVFE